MYCKNCEHWIFRGDMKPECNMHNTIVDTTNNHFPKNWINMFDEHWLSFNPGPEFGCVHFKENKK